MKKNKLKKYNLLLNISLISLTVYSIIFIAIFHIPYGKTIFFAIYFIIIIFFFFIHKKIEKENKDE
ncbi:hypothetical protein [Staphylococcus haemolyticus]|uniref:hypothetical protein n=1 Tax=Staphylococcus haemolyticus TaxID=1283 RepID=UPI0015D6D2E7|nr:hypothetical protein [Staphylococcus haemolyticus]